MFYITPSILIIDDTPENIDILANALEEDYEIIATTKAEKVMGILEKQKVDLILLDIMMPLIDGYTLCSMIKESRETRDIPVIFLTALTDTKSKTKGFSVGAIDYITKPFDILEVKARVKTHLTISIAQKTLNDQQEILKRMVEEKTKELEETQDITIRMAASLAETRDNDTGEHIMRTQHYIKEIAKELQKTEKYKNMIDNDYISSLFKSAPLHDIGKVGVPDYILLKPGKLTVEEFEEMKKHTIYGKESLERAKQNANSASFLTLAEEIAFSHHEKWDGSGYPQGLIGEAIPLSGRLMAIADVYDALISKRVYKSAMTHDEALQIMTKGRGSHFDPFLLDIFFSIQPKIISIVEKFKN